MRNALRVACFVVAHSAATLGAGRAGNLVFGAFLGVNASVPLLVVAASLLTGGLSSLLLPDTRGVALD